MENANNNEVTAEELKQAFQPEKKSKKKIVSIVIFIIGLAALVAGLVMLLLRLLSGPAIQDGELLVSADSWVLENDSNCAEETEVEANCEQASVIWKFTEIGKGTLTTNNHVNDYDFIWSLENGKLKVETKWLYDLNNEYDYKLDQGAGKLTLTVGEETKVLKAIFANEQ